MESDRRKMSDKRGKIMENFGQNGKTTPFNNGII